MRFYVYEHWRPDLDLPFYVGKGMGRRAYRLLSGRHNAHHRISIAKSGNLSVESRAAIGAAARERFADPEFRERHRLATIRGLSATTAVLEGEPQ